MSKIRDVVLNRIREIWLVENSDVRSHEHGFDWIPGSHEVQVRLYKDIETPGPERFRLTVATGLLHSLPNCDQDFIGAWPSWRRLTVRHLRWSSRCPKPCRDIRPAKPRTCTRSRPHIFTKASDLHLWLPAFFARMSVLQPIYAERYSERAAEALGGMPDFATGSRRADVDDVKKRADGGPQIARREILRTWIAEDAEIPFGSHATLIRFRMDGDAFRPLGKSVPNEREPGWSSSTGDACPSEYAGNPGR